MTDTVKTASPLGLQIISFGKISLRQRLVSRSLPPSMRARQRQPSHFGSSDQAERSTGTPRLPRASVGETQLGHGIGTASSSSTAFRTDRR
jgi:hypothetical protein